MGALGLLILGIFVGYIIVHGLKAVTDWSNPISTLNGVLSAAVAGGLFALIAQHSPGALGDAIFYYPIGLGYGALCRNLEWVHDGKVTIVKALHLIAFGVATVLLLALMLRADVRSALP